jgi:hypothetical protein
MPTVAVSRGSVSLVLSLIVAGVSPAQQDAGFAGLISTPAGIQVALERCDGHPDFETALANWLETAEPRSREEREAVRNTSLRLLEDTTDSQIVFGLIDGLLRHALEDVRRDPANAPKNVALTLYGNISRAVRGQKHKAKELALLAGDLTEGGVVKDERQASFVRDIVRLAEPPAPLPVSVAKTSPPKAAAPSAFTPKPTAISTRMPVLSQP